MRYDDGLSALHDAPDNTFADAIRHAMRGILVKPVTGFDPNLLALAIEEHHETAKHAVVTPECFERRSEGCFEIAGVGEQSTDFEQRAELSHFASFTREQFRTL